MDISRDAPVVASAETLIRAPIELVWAIHTNIGEWRRWNPGVTRVDMRGPLEPGTEFHWKAGGANIVSVLQDVEPMRRISWTGKTIGIQAVHVWTFEQIDDAVRVHSAESFDGWLVRLSVRRMQRMLDSSLEQGVGALRAESERRFREGARDNQ